MMEDNLKEEIRQLLFETCKKAEQVFKQIEENTFDLKKDCELQKKFSELLNTIEKAENG